MNRKLFGALTTIVLALVVNATVATAQTRTKADVPFDFVVGQKVLPAGTYNVSEMSQHAILIRNAHTSKAAMINAQAAEKLNPQSPKLVFHEYGDRYFLYQAWDGSTEGVQFPESKLEKEYRASNQGAAPQEIVLALR